MQTVNPSRRVVITGMGVMSAVGIGVQATWDGLVAGRSGVTRINSFEPERVDSKIAASVAEFDASTEEVAQMIIHLRADGNAGDPQWDRALAGHSAAERTGARVYVLEI